MLKNKVLLQKQASALDLVPSPLKACPHSRSFTMLSQALLLALVPMASLSTLVLVQSANAETFYKWVDKDGSTHYTQAPPRKTSVRSAKKVYIDDQAPATPAANMPANGENNNNTTGNSTPVMNANQLATAANNASVPNVSNSAQPASSPAAPQQVITPIIAPPANRLIVPTQDQARPAFSER